MRAKAFVVGVAAMAVCACKVSVPVVKARAAHDFECQEDQVNVVEIASTQYAATGCGKKAVYVCANEKADPVCVRDSQINPAN